MVGRVVSYAGTSEGVLRRVLSILSRHFGSPSSPHLFQVYTLEVPPRKWALQKVVPQVWFVHIAQHELFRWQADDVLPFWGVTGGGRDTGGRREGGIEWG